MLGKNAHAWPEVWFDGLGWVPFEPTPGRGDPGTEAYTGVAAAQDESAPGPDTGDGGTPRPSPTCRHRRHRSSRSTRSRRHETVTPTGLDPSGLSTTVPDRGINWIVVAIVFGVLILLLLLPEVVRRWRRRPPAGRPGPADDDLWWRALGAVEATGCRVDPTLTPIEQARAVSPRLPVAARPLKSLAEVATAATYATDEEVAAPRRRPGRRRAGPAPVVPPGRAHRRRLDDGGRPLRRYFTVWA